MCPTAARDGEAAEGHGHGGAGAHALLEEALAPVLALDPLRAGGGCDHQEGRDHAAREGDYLQTSNRVHTRIELALYVICLYESRHHPHFVSIVPTRS